MNPIAQVMPELTEPGRHDVEDAVIEEARQRARRRRRRYGLVVAVAVAVACVAGFVTLDRTPPSQSPAPVNSVDRLDLGHVESTGVAWCVPDPADPDGEELIVGAGPPVKTFCSYTPMHDGPKYCPAPCPSWNGARANHLFHTGGITILMTMGGTYRVADGRLMPLGGGGSFGISHDGRYLATTSDQCGGGMLSVRENATAKEVATTRVPDPGSKCRGSNIAGVDETGRVYVTVIEDRAPPKEDYAPYEVLMYDMQADQWTQVTGIPTVDGRFPTITYMTATGFAVSAEEQWAAEFRWPVASVEGVVDAAGRFTPQRRVPVGLGVWSPDGAYVAEGRLEGVVVRPVADLSRAVLLDPPVDHLGVGAPGTNIQWESSTSALVQGWHNNEERVSRCDVRSGACEVVNRAGWMALGENAAYGG